MAELHWFPFFPQQYLSSPAVQVMLPEQQGAYVKLLALAWGNGEAEPGLPLDDASLARLSGLGARWKKLGALVRDQFTERDGLLRNERLSAIWTEQQRKHSSAATRGKHGGEARAAKLKHGSSSATSLAQAKPVANAKHIEVELETTSKASAPDGAPPASWVGRLAAVWSAEVGPVQPGRLGKALKPLVDAEGEERVYRAMKAHISVRKAEGKTCNLKWFADEGQVWIERTKEPMGVVGGEMSTTLELLTRPAAKAS